MLLLALGSLALVCAVATAISAAASGTGVKIKGRAQVSAGEIKAKQDINGEKYTVRSEPHKKGVTKPRYGTSIETIVRRRNLNQQDFGYLIFPRSDGSSIYLSSDDIFHPKHSFPDGPAFVTVKSGSTRLFRPLRKDKSDVNAGDLLESKPGQPLGTVEPHQGNVLAIAIESSENKPGEGDSVQLTATPEGRKPGETISFSWQFSDGETAEGETVSHTVDKQGSFVATVTASGDEDSGGEASVALDVGKPSPAPSNGGSGGVVPGYNPGSSYNPYPYDYGSGIPPATTTPNPSPPETPAPSPQKDPAQSAPAAPDLQTISGTLVTDLSPAGSPSGASPGDPAPAPSAPSPSVVSFEQNNSATSLTLPLTGLGVLLLFLGGAGRELLESRRRQL